MATKKKMTPEQELRFLCDLSVRDCVAHISEFSPAAEYFVNKDAEVLIKSLQKTPDLTGIIIDGLTSVHRPGILKDGLVFYNLSEEAVLEHLEKIPRHKHVHWMFNKIMEFYDEWFGKFRKALPKVKMVYSVDSDDFHHTSQRMLRVIVQSKKVQTEAAKKSLEARSREFQNILTGFGKLKETTLQKKIRELEAKCKKHTERREKKRAKKANEQITEIKARIELINRRQELEAKLKVFRGAKDKKRISETEAELVTVKSDVNIKEKGLINALYTMEAERERLFRVKGKQKERDALDKEINKCKKKISVVRGKIADIDIKTEYLEKGLMKFGREPETSPVYQRRVAEHVRKLYERFNKLGEKHDIRIVTKPDVLVFGSLVIDYAHDRGRTWHPMPSRVKNLPKAFHGMMEDYQKNISAVLKEMGAKTRNVDVIMESGQSGAFFACWQRLWLTSEEIRMQHVNTFYTGGNDGVKHVTYIVGMPFEPQDNIAKYPNRGKPGRTQGGKPMGSASHAVFIRNDKRSVSGVTLVRKHNHDIISVEPIFYHLYRNKDILKPFKAVASQDDSDNHFNSPEMDPLGTLGTLAMNDQLMEHPLELYGTKVYIGGKFNLGDTGEAGFKSWKEAYKFRREIMNAAKKIPARLVGMNQKDYESVLETTLFYLNDMMGGSQNNMKLTQRTVAWYFKKQFLNVYHKSPTRLRDIFAHVTGNHFDNASRDSGMQEHDAFEDWLLGLKTFHEDFPEMGTKPFSLKIEAGGEPQYFQEDEGDHEIVVHTGGYSTSRQGLIKKYGIGHDGKLKVQKTYRVGMSHEPNSALGKARNQKADVIKFGHTHNSLLYADKSGPNQARLIDQVCTTQRVTATELSYGGIPRTAGVEIKVYTQPGRYFKMTIPMQHMRRIGIAWLKIISKKAIEKGQKKSTPKKTTKKKVVTKKKVPTPKKAPTKATKKKPRKRQTRNK